MKLSNNSVLLRRSLIGSLRSVSRAGTPFTSPSITAESSFRTETRQSGRETPASQKGPLEPIAEEERPPPPELDRTVDLSVLGDLPIEETSPFEQLLCIDGAACEGLDLLSLPPIVRLRIYGYCFPDETRKINLSPRFAIKAVFPDDYFASPWNVLAPVSGGLQASSALRKDLMIYFWTRYHFHITLNPFSGPRFSPLSHVWLLKYLEIVQYLDVEADLTRFGCSALRLAPQFGYDMNKVENLLVGVVNGLLKRRGRTTMAELNLMCRRYAGFRPYDGADDETFKFDPIQYCPDETLYLCDALCNLRGILRKARISGFIQEYTELLLCAIFAEGDIHPDYNMPDNCAWPPVPEQPTFPTFDSPTPVPMIPVSHFDLSFTRTSSFAQDFRDEMLKYESSVYSDNSNPQPEDTLAKEQAHLPRSGTITSIEEHVQKYQDCVISIAASDKSNYGHSPLLNCNPWSSPRTQFRGSPFARCPTDDSARGLLTITPTFESRCSTPKSPNAMNKMNEQDPAFLRSVNALRSLESEEEVKTPKRPRLKSMIPSPRPRIQDVSADRCKSAMTARPRNEGTFRRYLPFIGRLRGRSD